MQTEHLSVAGMKCSGCVDSVSRMLRAVRGVKNVSVSLTMGSAAVQFDERITSVDRLMETVENAGFGANAFKVTREPHDRGSCCSQTTIPLSYEIQKQPSSRSRAHRRLIVGNAAM